MIDFLKLCEGVEGIIHVGAHRGEELTYYNNSGIKYTVFIEPNPDVFKELEINVRESSGCKIFNVACGNTSGVSPFYIIYGPDAGYMVGNKGCSSFLEPIGRFKSWVKGVINVPVVRLDDFTLSEINPKDYQLINLDTQGTELDILKGAEKLLKHLKYVYVEVTHKNFDYKSSCSFQDIVSYLEDQKFQKIKYFPITSDWGDCLFEKLK